MVAKRARKATKASDRQSELPLETASHSELRPCPNCGKRQGELVDTGAGRFRYYVTCRSCVFMTDRARTVGVALKLWNEAKPVGARG